MVCVSLGRYASERLIPGAIIFRIFVGFALVWVSLHYSGVQSVAVGADCFLFDSVGICRDYLSEVR